MIEQPAASAPAIFLMGAIAGKFHGENAVQVFFKDGSATRRIQVDYPIGHRRRREEGMPVLVKKFESSVNAHFEPRQAATVNALFADAKVDDMPVDEFVNTMVVR